MRTCFTALPSLLLVLVAGVCARAEDSAASAESGLRWFAFPDSAKFKVLGLPWFEVNQPKFWRMPAAVMDTLPKGVQNQARRSSGGRILLRCTTTRLSVRTEAVNGDGAKRFEAYVDGQPCKPVESVKAGVETELVLFQGLGDREKEIVIYLPHLQEVVVKAIGVDERSRFGPPERKFARPLPVVFYGSSVCQGSAALSPAHTYPAILCRELNVDFVNLGFGGSGKAEAPVVDLVNSVPGCCYVFDLGKSYGMQDATAFRAMIETIRRRHPAVPIIAVTPITSVKEVKEPDYSARSVHTRKVMREPVQDLIKAGDRNLFLVEGEDLIGFTEHDALSRDGVHPSDRGYGVIAGKLAPLFRRSLGL